LLCKFARVKKQRRRSKFNPDDIQDYTPMIGGIQETAADRKAVSEWITNYKARHGKRKQSLQKALTK